MKAVAVEVSLVAWWALVFNLSEDLSDIFQFTVKEKYQPVVDLACGMGRLFFPPENWTSILITVIFFCCGLFNVLKVLLRYLLKFLKT